MVVTYYSYERRSQQTFIGNVTFIKGVAHNELLLIGFFSKEGLCLLATTFESIKDIKI
jgi:hypothetical protein